MLILFTFYLTAISVVEDLIGIKVFLINFLIDSKKNLKNAKLNYQHF